MDLFLQRLFDALTNGSTYALIAVAMVLIFKATTLINFAQGEQAMLGAFIVLQLWKWGIPMWGAVVIGMVFSGILAACLERTFIRKFDPADHLPLVIITLGLFLVINAVAAIIWRFDPLSFPQLFPSGRAVTIGNARLSWYSIFAFGSCLLVLFVLQTLLTKTKIGLAFRAVSSNLESSRLCGIKIGQTLQFGWALAAAAGTLGASIYAANPVLQIEPTIMLRALIFSITAAALGGLDSLWGALIGGLTIGFVQSVVVQYIPFIPNEMTLAAAVVVLLIVLTFRPSGFLGTKTVERV
ncbi:MAG: branched-chain amino acid ABC transporter permease [Acidimicrobiales bacterium]|jgi:branched-chain amino acid transport system permease protein|nr:branched-chain amino acid ABC transporter permease [Acidimicrobiales bacterium]MDP6299220.1 branched-chain amino acid ABC transporter permease [Acidimicrobiales bacterium]HJM28314.1 branched-chain amino acid ABC transporter permease [Acidimicrobiales bacterium]HJM98051.1 branched-chain amino acid ABC transporter permease [Acidimicrobiales bacterium]